MRPCKYAIIMSVDIFKGLLRKPYITALDMNINIYFVESQGYLLYRYQDIIYTYNL